MSDALVECGFRLTPCAKFGPPEGVRFHLPRNRPPFLEHYSELHHPDVSLLINKNDVSQFDLMQCRDGARHIRNSVRELSDHA